MRDDFKALKSDLTSGLTGSDYDLGESMKKAIPVRMAMQLGEPSWDELFS
jgi:hypothetical protein